MKHCRSILLTGLVGISTPIQAQTLECSTAAMNAYGIHGVTVTETTIAEEGAPACIVDGEVVTSGDGAGEGLSRFRVRLPEEWNKKFLMFGNGGLAGRVKTSANAEDIAYAHDNGYVTAMTDLGHVAESIVDARFALKEDGTPNDAAVVDYYYRASHVVTEVAKAFAEAAYGAKPDRSYFSGCSTGGRMAQVAATRYPDDFDGVISGAPFMDISSMLKIQHFQINQLLSEDAQILPAKRPAIQAAVMASCDAVDGVEDGLIQNPGACSFEPESIICSGEETDDCLTPAQAKSLRAYFTALHTDDGKLVYPGYAPVLFDDTFSLFQGGKEPAADIKAAEPWGNDGFGPAPIEWSFSDHIIRYLVMEDPSYDVRTIGIDPDGTVPAEVVAKFVEKTGPGNGSNLDATERFLNSGKKMILYHGWGDHALTPFRTTRFVDDMARRESGYENLAAKARLFMVPGMAHCGGGTGPNSFNTLAALEAWIEKGVAPDEIMAVKYGEEGAATRSMPLCVYPSQAVYSGKGDVMDGANWSCSGGTEALQMGSVGIAAGMLTAGEPTQ